MKYYWVCEHYSSGVGMFRCHAWYTSRRKARQHARKLNRTEKFCRQFYITERDRPLHKMEMV